MNGPRQQQMPPVHQNNSNFNQMILQDQNNVQDWLQNAPINEFSSNLQSQQVFCNDGHQMQWSNQNHYPGADATVCDICDRDIAMQFGYNHCFQCESDFCPNCTEQRIRKRSQKKSFKNVNGGIK
jgi:hypothetical protein